MKYAPPPKVPALLGLLAAFLVVAARADTVQANAVIYYPFDSVAAASRRGNCARLDVGLRHRRPSASASAETITLNGNTYNDADGNHAAFTFVQQHGYAFLRRHLCARNRLSDGALRRRRHHPRCRDVLHRRNHRADQLQPHAEPGLLHRRRLDRRRHRNHANLLRPSRRDGPLSRH